MKIALANTVLYCRYWPETANFYQHILGFKVSYSRKDWFVELELNPGCHLSLADASRCSIAAGEGRGLTLSFGVEDLNGTHSTCINYELSPTPITANHAWRAPFFYLNDPEGNRIEFWSLTGLS